MSKVSDDFFGGSIRKDLRRSPQTIVNLYKTLLKSNNFKVSKSNLDLVLSVSKELYQFIGEKGEEELEDYRKARSKEPQVRGPVVPCFDLVVEVIRAIIKYVHDHPKDSLESVAAFVVIEQFIEQKMGNIVAKIWRKISNESSNSAMRRQIADLNRLERKKKDIDYRNLR